MAQAAAAQAVAVPVAYSQNDDPAMADYRDGDYAEAIAGWTPRANAGEADAQYWLGQVYYQGKGVPQDFTAAMDWFRKAARQGHDYGQYWMGRMYEDGSGVAPNYANAAFWYVKACDQNVTLACFHLGGLYERGGAGLPRDLVQAYEAYELGVMAIPSNSYVFDDVVAARDAVAARLTPAQLSTATQWLQVRKPGYDGPARPPVPKPIPTPAVKLDTRALIRLTLSAQLGDAPRQAELGQAFLGYRGVTKDYALALGWLKRAADQDYEGAQVELGRMYRDSVGVPQDYAAAADWFRKAADHGYGEAQYQLGKLYESGLGVAQDDVQAYLWYDLSTRATRGQLFDDADAKARDAIAGRITADRLVQAKALAKAWQPLPPTQAQQVNAAGELYNRNDLAGALVALAPLAEAGSAQAQFWLGEMNDFGDGVPQNWTVAAAWYRKAGDQGHAGAQAALSRLYHEGHGVHQDAAAAAEWIEKAAHQGMGYAQVNWGLMYLAGDGVQQNAGSAVYLFQKAANQGTDTGMFYLGVMYFHGNRVKADPVEAYKWLYLAEIYAMNDEVRSEAVNMQARVATGMTALQISNARNMANGWHPVFPTP